MAELIPRARIPEGPGVGALPGARPQYETSAAPAVAVLGVAQRGLQHFAEQYQEREDTAALLQARRELSDFEGAAFAPDNADGISQYRGQNALRAGALVSKADERIGEIRSRLNPRQQARFDAVAGSFRDGFQSRVNGYMEREHGAYRDAESKAALDNLGDDAIAAGVAGDFEQQDLKATELLGMVGARAAAEGWGPEQTRAAERAVASNVRSRTILGMSADKPFAAWEYYQAHQQDLSPEDRQRVDAVLQPVVKDAEYRATADAIMLGGEPPGTTDVDAQIESLEGSGANPNSSATGVGQFLDSTWLDVIGRHRPDLAAGKSREQILALRSDPAIGREMIQRYRQDNATALTARGVQPTAVNLYAAHHFGPGGAMKFASAGADTPMSSILSARELAANPYLQGKTKGQVVENWARRGLRAGAASDGAAPGGVPRSKADALEVANLIADPAERAGVIQKINAAFAIRDAREAEREQQLSEAANMAIASNTDPSASLAQVIGPEAFALAQRKGRVQTLENLRTATIAGTLIQDDPILADELFRQAAVDPNGFKKRDLYGVADQLSTGTLSQLLKMQAEATKPGTANDWATAEERLNVGFTMLGISTAGDARGDGSQKKNEDRHKMRGEFRLALQAAERTLVQNLGGKKPTPEQADALVRNTARAFAVRMQQGTTGVYSSAATYETQISEGDRAAVRAAYQQKYGRPPTDAWVTRYIIAKQGGVAQ